MSNKKYIQKILNDISTKANDEASLDKDDVAGYVTFGYKPTINEETLELDPNAEIDVIPEEYSELLSQVTEKIGDLIEQGMEDRDIISSISDQEMEAIEAYLSQFIMADVGSAEVEPVGDYLAENEEIQKVTSQSTPVGCITCLISSIKAIRQALTQPQNADLLRCVIRKGTSILEGKGPSFLRLLTPACLRIILSWRKLNPGVFVQDPMPPGTPPNVANCFTELRRIIRDITIGNPNDSFSSPKRVRGLKVESYAVPKGSAFPKYCVIVVSCGGVSSKLVVKCRTPQNPLRPNPIYSPGERTSDVQKYLEALERRIRDILDNLNNPPNPVGVLGECVLILPDCYPGTAEAIATGAVVVGGCAAGAAIVITAPITVPVVAIGGVCSLAVGGGDIGDEGDDGGVYAPLEWIEQQCALNEELQEDGLGLTVCEREYLCDINPDCCGPITSPECIDLIPMAEENCQEGNEFGTEDGEDPGLG